MRQPEFWLTRGLRSTSLIPFSWAYLGIRRVLQVGRSPWKAPVPVFCIGNLTVGGSGKTPVALELARMLIDRGRSPHFLSRGYGRKTKTPLRVDPRSHCVTDVGDEPLLLAQLAPVWVDSDRVRAAKLACASGADCLVMDDGFQNFGLYKDYSVIVIDGSYGFGNGRIIPSGPLREQIGSGCERAQVAILIGEDSHGVSEGFPLETINADIIPIISSTENFKNKKIAAFAGIGRPEKFFDLLKSLGADLIVQRSFPDHHCFSEADLKEFTQIAKRGNAEIYTTEKDYQRVPMDLRMDFQILPVKISWKDTAAPSRMLDKFLENG
ncbi:MAG: tetraacyldisaccharide 4'-kinase [Rhodospirillaceae bacterium]